ncbi:MAG: DUF1552 domain-containing protein [Polyangiaceae bacterium]|nr:DUF1552 domain-containing protein [Polyangiaceae bacterium]
MLIKTHRRKFLGALGTATFAASALRYFIKSAEAQTAPKRFVFLFTPNGADSGAASTGTGTGYTLGPDMTMFEPLKSKFSVLDGLQIPDHGGEEHPSGRCSMLSAWRSSGSNATAGNRGQSIDIFLRDKIANGASVYMGTHAPDDALDLPISWVGPGQRNSAFVGGPGQVAAVQAELFRNAPTMPPPATTSTAEAKTQNELALNSYLTSELNKLRSVAPAAEYAKLDQHLQALSQIRTDLGGTGNQFNGVCDTSISASSDDADKMGLLLAHAIACNQTKVAVFRIGSYEPSHVHSHWQEGGMQGFDGEGCAIIDTDNMNDPALIEAQNCHRAKFRAISKVWAQNIKNFLTALDSIPEGTGTVLDNTAVVWSSELSGHYLSDYYKKNYAFGAPPFNNPFGDISEGSVNTHGTVDMPFWMAGGKNLGLIQGQRIVAQDRYAGELYKAIALQMGVPMGDLGAYGEPHYAPGILQEVVG